MRPVGPVAFLRHLSRRATPRVMLRRGSIHNRGVRMRYVLITIGVVVGLVVVVVGLLVLNLVLASGRQRKQARARLAPVLDPLDAGQVPDPAAVRQLASSRETRNALYDALAERGKESLFPREYRTRQAFAESDLAFWLSHPNELKQSPDEMQLAQVVTMPSDAGPVEYYLFRFRTREPHWAADKGWMAGVSGPYPKDPKAPLASPAGTFSELEPFEAKSPQEHVRAFHEHAVASGAIDALRKQLQPQTA